MTSESQSHRLTLNERSHLTMSGVTEVVSFDDTAIVLQTCMGALVIQGTQLQLKTLSLDGGQIDVTGTVSSLTYEESHSDRSWLSRLFR